MMAANAEQVEVEQRDVTLDMVGMSGASAESSDYVDEKKQFQLHTLLTEQRHRATFNLSQTLAGGDYEGGIAQLFEVDADVVEKLAQICDGKQEEGGGNRDLAGLELMVRAAQRAMEERRKIYVYGCGATGRLAKQMESDFWRPFWTRMAADHAELFAQLGWNIEDALIGEMTGGDRALISSLEGFEDIPLIGELQLKDRGVTKGDVVICVTEGGETSSVIGTVLAGLAQYSDSDPLAEKQAHLFFVYNNPDQVLLPFERSRTVLENACITKVNLATGPQSITGSTRMQATSSETFVVATVLQCAIQRHLLGILTPEDVALLGFAPEQTSLSVALQGFRAVRDALVAQIPSIAAFTKMEADCYQRLGRSTYLARDALITVFIDGTERSPTFRLYPIDRVDATERKSLIRVWTAAENLEEAWRAFLYRPFRGLAPSWYQLPFQETIADPYLRRAALASLQNAGTEQGENYDFSFPAECKDITENELAVAILRGREELEQLRGEEDSFWRRFIARFQRHSIAVLVCVEGFTKEGVMVLLEKVPGWVQSESKTAARCLVVVDVATSQDPLHVKQQLALKAMLNAHSTAVMAAIGKVVGNTMTNVNPSNLKLVGRATFLVQSHVNDVLQRRATHAQAPYRVVNAVLYDTIAYVQNLRDSADVGGSAPEVGISIVRLIESVLAGKPCGPEQAYALLQEQGSLANYLHKAAASDISKK